MSSDALHTLLPHHVANSNLSHHPHHHHHHHHHHQHHPYPLAFSDPHASHVILQIERSLEEGQETGQLILSGQHIKAYPAKLAASFNLSDVVAVDLSKNRLTEVDVAICDFFCLQSLNVYNNLIKSIPQELTRLQFLKTLNLSRNQLTALPITICQLTRLRVC